MRSSVVTLLSLALNFGCISASAASSEEPLGFLNLPTELREYIFESGGLTTYANFLKAVDNRVPLVGDEFEAKLLGGAAEEVKHLEIYNDNQRERLSAILKDIRAIINQRSGLPTTIDPDTDINTRLRLAARFESTFYRYSSLSSSPTWAKFCMTGLLGKNTLITLWPYLSKGFFDEHRPLMLQAAAVVADFDTLRAVATHPGLSSWRSSIKDDALFSGSVDFVLKIVEFAPDFIHDCSLLETAIKLNHRPLFNYLYAESMKQKSHQEALNDGIALVLEALAGRGWEDEFKQLHSEHPGHSSVMSCLREAANHGRINILKYLINLEGSAMRGFYLGWAFEGAVGSGNIDAIEFLLGNDESGDPLIPDLSLTKPTPIMLGDVGRSGRWEGIKYLMDQKNKGDARFENFELAGDASGAVKKVCYGGNLQVLKQLLQQNAQGQFVFTFEDPTSLLQKSLLSACEQGHLPIVQELLKYSNVDPAHNDNEALVAAGANGHHLVVRELLRDGRLKASASNTKILIAACHKGYPMVVAELLQQRDGQYIYGINPCVADDEPLIAACIAGNPLVVHELLQHECVDPGAKNNEALIRACKCGHFLVVRELLQKDNDGKYIYNVDPAARNNQCLIAACYGGSLQIVEFLLQGRPNADRVMEYEHAGIDAAAQDNMPLLSAIRGEHTNIVKLLLQKTNKGDSVFPRVAIPEQMRWMATFLRDGELRKLLE